MNEPLTPEEAWDMAIDAAAAECTKNALRGDTAVGARDCFEIETAILSLKGREPWEQ